MSRTQIDGGEIQANTITRGLININIGGSALITRLLTSGSISIASSTGADSGTGDVTITDSAVQYNAQTLTAAQKSQVITNLSFGTIVTQNANNVTLTGGSINNTAIGATTPSTVAGTTGNFSGQVTATYLYATGALSSSTRPSTALIGNYYTGLAVQSTSNNATAPGDPIFGVLGAFTGGNGLGQTAFTVYSANVVTTFNSTIDDGAGNAVFKGTVTSVTAPVGTRTTQLATTASSFTQSLVNSLIFG